MESHNNSWNANFVTISSKKCWVLTHSLTRYTVLLPDVTAKKMKSLRWWFMDQLINQYLKDDEKIDFAKNVKPELFDSFFGDFTFYPTNNDRSCISYVNQRIMDLKWYKFGDYEYDDISFYGLGATINHICRMKREGKSEYIYPNRELLELVNRRG